MLGDRHYLVNRELTSEPVLASKTHSYDDQLPTVSGSTFMMLTYAANGESTGFSDTVHNSVAFLSSATRLSKGVLGE